VAISFAVPFPRALPHRLQRRHCAAIANQNYFHGDCLVCSKAWLGMTELEVLDRDIDGLKVLLRVAWSELASSSLTHHERREARNRITLYSTELRHHLQTLEAERIRLRQKSLEQQGSPSIEKPQLRLLQGAL
jgi:hypothetical protein